MTKKLRRYTEEDRARAFSASSTPAVGAKGTKDNPYTQEEFEAMLEAGTWGGGYVGDEYIPAETTLPGITITPGGSSSYGGGDGWHCPRCGHPYPNILRIALLLCCGLAVPAYAQGDACRFLTAFYRQYMGNPHEIMPEEREDSLLRRGCTPALREKLRRMSLATDVVALYRAQDINEYMLQSLQTAPTEEPGWYLVSWKWRTDAEPERISLRLEQTGGGWKIAYVTPYYLGTSCGDSLFYRPGEAPTHVNGSGTAEEFLRSFYAAYAALYATLQPGTAKEAARMRGAWLLPEAEADFRQTEAEEAFEGYEGYDLLLCDFDFERTEIPAIRYTPLGGNTFRIDFPHNGFYLMATLSRTRDGWRIARLRRDYDRQQ